MKKVKLFEQFIVEGKDVFPNEIVGNDQILFKKEWEKMNGGKLAAKYNQYYRGYDIDFGGHIFNSVDQLEKFVKSYILSNNLYNKYKYMPEIAIKESNSGIDSDIKKLETLIRKQFNVVEFKAPSKRPSVHDEFLMVKVKDDKYGGPQTGLGKFIKRWTGVEASFVDNYGNDKVYWVSLEKIENGPGVHESTVNEEDAYSVTKNTFRDYDSLNITSHDSIQFKEDGKKWIVRCVTAHDNIDKGALQKLGFTNQGATRYAGISTFTKNANWHDLELTKKEFDQLVKIVDAGWASHAKAFADFYKDRQAD